MQICQINKTCPTFFFCQLTLYWVIMNSVQKADSEVFINLPINRNMCPYNTHKKRELAFDAQVT